MSWLFFTKGNGEVSSMPNILSLKTKAQRRKFIGDPLVDRFQVISNDKAPICPKWDGSKYITDSTEQAKRLQEKTDTEERAILLRNLSKVINGLEARIVMLESK